MAGNVACLGMSATSTKFDRAAAEAVAIFADLVRAIYRGDARGIARSRRALARRGIAVRIKLRLQKEQKEQRDEDGE